MKPPVKIILYAVLVICTVWFGRGFYANYSGAVEHPPERAVVPELPPEEAPGETPGETPEARPASRHETGRMMGYGAGFLIVVLGLGLMGAHDASKYFAAKAEDFIFNDDGEAMQDPEYEQAEKLWANGNHLEAIQLMREHLKKYPRHQYVSLRIAEIYENDLKNPVAAALEYEQILEHKLPPERWGWAAIHLANIYSGKLGKPEAAEAILRRIIREFGGTAAAKKARERLGEPEPEPVVTPPPPSAGPGPQEEADTSSNLPRGFRPKKG